MTVRFSSTIELVPKSFFWRADPLECRLEAGEFTPGDGQSFHVNDRVRVRSRAATAGASTCSIAGVANGEKGSVAHLSPSHFVYNQSGIQSALAEDSLALGAHGKPVRGLLLGNLWTEPGRDRFLQGIFSAFQSLTGYFDQKRMPLSVFWGQLDDDGDTGAFYNGDTDTWQIYVASQRRNALGRLDLEKPWVDVETPEQLRDAFQYIRVAPGDRLVIAGREVPPDQVNKNLPEV